MSCQACPSWYHAQCNDVSHQVVLSFVVSDTRENRTSGSIHLNKPITLINSITMALVKTFFFQLSQPLDPSLILISHTEHSLSASIKASDATTKHPHQFSQVSRISSVFLPSFSMGEGGEEKTLEKAECTAERLSNNPKTYYDVLYLWLCYEISSSLGCHGYVMLQQPTVPDIYHPLQLSAAWRMIDHGSILKCSNAEPQHCANGRMGIGNDLPKEVTLPYRSMPSMLGDTKPTENTKQVTTYSPRGKLRSTCCPCLKIVLIFVLWGLSRVLLGIFECEGLHTMATC
ncbi:uncharacterized protein Bfra_008147 [Botrytis fragariae]|uniref:Uncharacterized protein n=1 Tax=Botrytis fragariae TaxID=1964551 RepID=A0A8H6ASN5_9HELO|nr:uncharacterized protein Bfra_008147 [Botrytis fragariae]KAF5872871.1 hypothetical protein Bfra_008147 [Botrytis fragariae]